MLQRLGLPGILVGGRFGTLGGMASALSILFELFAASQKTKVLLNEAMSESPLTPTEYAVYSLIEVEGKITPTAMKERMGLPVTTLLDHLHEMESRGHSHRSPNPGDGRSYLVSLTSAGRGAHREAAGQFHQAMSRLLGHLDADESEVRAALVALGSASESALRQLRDNLARSAVN